jgi:hypothetical protein
VIPGMDVASKLLSLAIGVVIGPIFTVGLGISVARAASGAPAAVGGR